VYARLAGILLAPPNRLLGYALPIDDVAACLAHGLAVGAEDCEHKADVRIALATTLRADVGYARPGAWLVALHPSRRWGARPSASHVALESGA